MDAAPPPFVVTPLAQHCVSLANAEFPAVPRTLLRGILWKERGAVGTISTNKNGSHDLGPAQINTVWLKDLARYGWTAERLITDACSNVRVSAWILNQQLIRYERDWNKAIVAYHLGHYRPLAESTRARRYLTDVLAYWRHFKQYDPSS